MAVDNTFSMSKKQRDEIRRQIARASTGYVTELLNSHSVGGPVAGCRVCRRISAPAHDSGADEEHDAAVRLREYGLHTTGHEVCQSALDKVTKERDEARAEVQRCIAERDEATRRADDLAEAVRQYCRDNVEARAEVERLNKEADSLAQQREHWQLRFGEVCDERNEATDRIAALEAVIWAQSAHASSLARSQRTAFELVEAFRAAGIKPEIILPTESPAAASDGERGSEVTT